MEDVTWIGWQKLRQCNDDVGYGDVCGTVHREYGWFCRLRTAPAGYAGGRAIIVAPYGFTETTSLRHDQAGQSGHADGQQPYDYREGKTPHYGHCSTGFWRLISRTIWLASGSTHGVVSVAEQLALVV